MSSEDFIWPIPRSAYIHVPFCRHRCGYCNFSVIADRDDLVERFLKAIDRELAPLGRPSIDTLFIGGGTPTHLSVDALSRLLTMLAERFELCDDFEFSVEANPEDIQADKLSVLADHGVNRISLGVQSFQTDKLELLQRGHNGDRAREAIEASAKRIGNVSVDLIFAAPGEAVSDWETDLRTALDLPLQHLSTYALTFEKGTPFWNARLHGRMKGLDEATEVKMYQITRQMLAERGMKHYEVSNFALDGFRSRHNIAYWEGRGWYAAGPGAARFVDGSRDLNHRSTTTYLHRIEQGESAVAESDRLTRIGYARERAAFGIRMIDGIDLTRVSQETGVDLWTECEKAILDAVDRGLMIRTDTRIRLSKKGILFADMVAADLLFP
ncbi:Oxygen-independent coproporphyrinogen-III oxidase-like protein [Planctomycetes bacterium CA13]|uniref:Heme chaperone HemW n=1 Tax=Novipirellula herctigrandis TaxID=2527986 RepID=A0A5C5Z8D2_9BACT|nr:Oxygen-independent coproporphyrinogen-III oxidase-like protein [Planctomycetes bacterium CA13]